MGRISPAALTELKFIPMPTNSDDTANFTAARWPRAETPINMLARVDHNLTATQHIFGRYNFSEPLKTYR